MSEYPIFTLFHSEVYVDLVDLFINELDNTEKLRTGEIAERADMSKESVRQAMSPVGKTSLIEMGVVVLDDPEAHIPHYKRAETPVVEWLESYDGYPLHHFFDKRSTPKLTEFFLFKADPEKVYTQNKIEDITGISHRGFNRVIDHYLDSEMVVEVDSKVSYTEYRVNLDSNIISDMGELNNILIETFNKILDENERPA